MRLAAIGALTLIGGIASNAISEDLPPFFVAPGGVILVAGLLLVTVHVAGAKVLPPGPCGCFSGVLALIGV